MTPAPSLEPLRAAILATHPELSGARFTLLPTGWDCVAVDVDDRLIFRFPRHAEAERAMGMEARLLALIRPAVCLPVPDLSLHPGPPPFSRHAKIRGEHLLTPDYAALREPARVRLAADLALFYAQLHALGRREMAEAGAQPIRPWLPPDEILTRAWPALPERLRAFAESRIEAFRRLPPDPHGVTYGFFDGHGWNMAFDHAAGRLNGVYDFGDSGFGPLHQEFIYSNLIARDLTARIVDAYERLTGRALDRRRIELLTSVARLSEVAEFADDPTRRPAMLQFLADWAGS